MLVYNTTTRGVCQPFILKKSHIFRGFRAFFGCENFVLICGVEGWDFVYMLWWEGAVNTITYNSIKAQPAIASRALIYGCENLGVDLIMYCTAGAGFVNLEKLPEKPYDFINEAYEACFVAKAVAIIGWIGYITAFVNKSIMTEM